MKILINLFIIGLVMHSTISLIPIDIPEINKNIRKELRIHDVYHMKCSGEVCTEKDREFF